MIIPDFTPPADPTLDQQRDALRKGLGRVVGWAAAGKLDGNAWLAACLTEQRYDRQVDEARGNWLWRLGQTAGFTEHLRGPLHDALCVLHNDRDARQHCQLASCFAAAGDETFRTRLREIVETKPFPHVPWLGEEELLDLDGEQGFLVAATSRGRLLAADPANWDDFYLTRQAAERFGEARVAELLAASTDPDVQRYRTGWLADRDAIATPYNPNRLADEARATPLAELLVQARKKFQPYIFRRWGSYADDAGLAAVQEAILTATDPVVLANLLRVFSTRSLLAFDNHFLALARHGDEAVRLSAYVALEQSTHPAIRDFAWAQLPHDPAAVGLLVRNFTPGDEDHLFDMLDLPADPDATHSALLDVLKILDENTEVDVSRLGLLVYGLTPCGMCRADAAVALRDANAAPNWLRAEYPDDAEQRCREVFVGKTASVDA